MNRKHWHWAKVAPVSILIIAMLVLAFGLVGQVIGAVPSTFDRNVMLALRKSVRPSVPIGPAWLQEAARDITSLGSIIVLAIITFAIVGYLLLTRKPVVAWLMLIAVFGGIALNDLLKFAFARPRPDIRTRAVRVFTTSFPSGHATLSAISYLTIAALLARTYPSFTIYFISLAAFLTVMIGTSRIYLGVHYPTDVLGGWCIGGAWAMACWALVAWLQVGGQVEPPSPS